MITVSKLKEYASDVRVLYVEDDKDIQEEIHDFLRRFFPIIDLADNGEEGLNKYKNSSYDIVISDINMPKMDGIEMVSAIKQINEDQRVIITSAYNESKYLMKLIDIGVDKFVLKPFNNKKFLFVLYKMCEFIYSEKQNELLQKEIAKKIAETQTIVDMMEHGVILMDKGVITQVNMRFLELSNYKSLELFNNEIQSVASLFEKHKGYIEASNNEELIQLLESDENQPYKAIIKNELEDIVYLLKCKKIDNEKKYVISFTDITDEEQLVNIDVKTGLPNIYAATADIEHRIDNHLPFVVDIIRVENIEKMVKWHGQDIKNSVDENVAKLFNTQKKELNKQGVFVAYYGENKFIMIRNEKMRGVVEKMMNKISLITALKEASVSEKNNIFYKPAHLFVEIQADKNTCDSGIASHCIEEIIKTIDEKFEKIFL